MPSSPLGKLQELVQLFRGVDITQGVLGVNEDEASDPHALKPAENRTFSVLPEGEDGQAPRWGSQKIGMRTPYISTCCPQSRELH